MHQSSKLTTFYIVMMGSNPILSTIFKFDSLFIIWQRVKGNIINIKNLFSNPEGYSKLKFPKSSGIGIIQEDEL